MRGVQGAWGLEVLVDGRDLKLDPSKIGSFSIINNIHQQLPTINFSYKDDTGKELDRLSNDGAEIECTIGNPAYHMYEGLKFRQMGPPKVQPGTKITGIQLQGVLDKIGYMRKVVDKFYEGTASSAIAQLAGEVGLIPDIHSSSDAMTWLPNRTTIAEYVRHVTDRAYASSKSAFITAVSDASGGILKLKDLDRLVDEHSGITLSSNRNSGLNILHWVAEPKSIVTNSAQGYGSTSIGQNQDGTIFEGNQVAMKMISSALGIGKVFQDAVGTLGSRINIMAPLTGNTHENWYQALHQNTRIKSTFAFDVAILTDVPTKLELLDVATVLPGNPVSGGTAASLAGNYIVTAITKTISHNRYLEKVVLTAQGAGGV